MSSHVVVLGGSGFIGSYIARGCAGGGRSCTALGSRDCDLTDPEACAEILPALCDGRTVVYAAGIPRVRADTPATLQANQAMVHNLVHALREARPSRLVFTSTVEVYGIPGQLPINEQTEIRPRTLYAVGKVAAELILRHWHDDTGTPLAVLRLPGIYGRGDHGRSVVGKLVESAHTGQPFPLAGDGAWRRDYVWVEDIARVVTALTDTEFTEVTLNVATGRSLSIREVIDRVAALYGPVPLAPVSGQRPDGHLEFDTSQWQAVLPNVELTGLEDGLKCYTHAMREAVFATDDIVEVGPATIEKLKTRAADSPRRQSRLCMHHSVDDTVHEMINACCRDAYIRPHRHPEGKTESYHVIEGRMTVYFFDDDGRVVRRIRMGGEGTGATFLYRLSACRWHLPVADSDMIVYHETFRGPFERDRDVEYAPWSPAWDDPDAVAAFLERIEER